MTVELIKRMMDACYQAKRVRDLLPPLPKGVMPSYIHYLDSIQKLEQQGVQVKVSDLSDALNLPRPGVTRTVKEMEAKGYLKKTASAEDGRVTYLSITEAGAQLSQTYDKQFFDALVPCLQGVPEADVETTIRTIDAFHQVFCERRTSLEI
jgi:DNA-binding MarR family transcriptional regulator